MTLHCAQKVQIIEVRNRNKKNGGMYKTPTRNTRTVKSNTTTRNGKHLFHANGIIPAPTRMMKPMRTVKQNLCGDVFHIRRNPVYMWYRTTNNTRINRL